MIMNTIPKKILNILLKTKSPLSDFCFIKTNQKGIIKDYFGPINKYSNDTIKKDEPATEFFSFLNGLYPFKEKELMLSNLQIRKKKYTNVLILNEENKEVWILFFDVTRSVKKYEKIISRRNKYLLKEEKATTSENDNPLGHLELFEIATFRKTSPEGYKPKGILPEWIYQLKPELQKMPAPYKLNEVFPFLDVFEMEVADFWKKNESGIYKSGQWIESDKNGKEYLMKAFATNHKGKSYLLLRMLNNELSGGQEVYQKAREQQLAYEKLAKAENRLKELLEYKEKFVSIISHDLRSPIASVYGVAQMLTNDDELKSKLDDFSLEMLYGIKSEMARLLDYNDKLYHWSNLELGNFNINLEKVTVKKLAETVARTAEHALKNKNISFQTNIPDTLTITVDITLFLQALNNLIANAIKFTPEGGIVGINAQRDNVDKITISVYDTGVGMPEDVKEKLFKQQTTSMGTKGEKGSGLGLGIVKKVIENHGFDISVESIPGKGSQFIISIFEKKDKVPN